MPDQPVVSVLTATYNGQNFLPQTIESVCSQTFQNFEYILIDDASTDRTPQILAQYAGQDKRIHVLRNAAKRGPAASLNQGLDRARGVYVANLDHDDIALPQRFSKQVAFLDSQAQVGVVGTWARLIDSQDRQLGLFAGPTQPAVIRWLLLMTNPLIHSSVLMRRAVVQHIGGYTANHRYACDYDLFSRLSFETAIANLPEPLTAYRWSPGQASHTYRQVQGAEILLSMYAAICRLLAETPPLEDVNALQHTIWGQALRDVPTMWRVASLIQRLYHASVQSVALSHAAAHQIQQDFAQKLMTLAWNNRRLAWKTCAQLTSRAVRVDPTVFLRSTTWQTIRQQRNLRRLSMEVDTYGGSIFSRWAQQLQNRYVSNG